MSKFAALLIIGLFLDAEVNKSKEEVTQRVASIVYSEKAMGYESGQPVFTDQVKATLLSKSDQDGVRVTINDSLDATFNSEVIELYELVDFSPDTYTVIIESGDETETFGFTIR